MNNTTNLTDYSEIIYNSGETESLNILIVLTVIYSLIFVTGVIGNVITCFVISSNKSMHSATNYYLFSLAVSDLLLLISGLPHEISVMWYHYPYPFNEAVCVIQGFAAETSSNATVLTITAFTIERYVAICHPFLSHTMSKLSRAIKFILLIWMVSICLAVPQILDLGITKEGNCTMKRRIKLIFTVSTILIFILPMILISVLYILIGLQLRKSKIYKTGTTKGSRVQLIRKWFEKKRPSQAVVNLSSDCNNKTIQHEFELVQTLAQFTPIHISGQPNNEEPEDGRKNYSNRSQSRGARHVVNMLVAVVVAFFISWAPFHAQRLFAVYIDNNNEQVFQIYIYLTNISGVTYFLSTCVNPFLYHIMSNKFRKAFKDTISRYICKRSKPPQRLESYLNGLPTSKRPLVVSFRKIPRDQIHSSSSSTSNMIYEVNVKKKFQHEYSDTMRDT